MQSSTDETHATPAKQGFFGKYYLIALAFLLQQLIAGLSTINQPYSIFTASDFARFDSYLYYDIAKNGIELYPCWQKNSAYPKTSTEMCGNAGWMPLYPYCVRAVMKLGFNEYTASFLVSRICTLVALIFLFLILKPYPPPHRALSMILAGVFPSSIYYASAFPISLNMALVLGSYYSWTQGRQILAFILAFLIPFTYASGFANMVPWGMLMLFYLIKGSGMYRRCLLPAIAIALGFGAFFVLQKLTTGVWNGFFLIQGKYGHGFHWIWQPILEMIKVTLKAGLNDNWRYVQTLIFLGIWVWVCIASFSRKEQQDPYLNFYYIVLCLFPLFIGSLEHSHYRSQALLLPIVAFLGRHKVVALLLIPVFIYLSICCGIDFFTSKIA